MYRQPPVADLGIRVGSPACEKDNRKIDQVDLPSCRLEAVVPEADHACNGHGAQGYTRAGDDPPAQEGHPCYHKGREPFVFGRGEDEGGMVLALEQCSEPAE